MYIGGDIIESTRKVDKEEWKVKNENGMKICGGWKRKVKGIGKGQLLEEIGRDEEGSTELLENHGYIGDCFIPLGFSDTDDKIVILWIHEW
jgi:hypothetical protein